MLTQYILFISDHHRASTVPSIQGPENTEVAGDTVIQVDPPPGQDGTDQTAQDPNGQPPAANGDIVIEVPQDPKPPNGDIPKDGITITPADGAPLPDKPADEGTVSNSGVLQSLKKGKDGANVQKVEKVKEIYCES